MRSVVLAELSLVERRVGRAVVQEVGARGQRSKAEAGRVEGDAVDGERGLGGFVEGQLEVVTIQQIDAVEGRILRGCRDLRDDVVVLAHQAGANGLRSRIGNRGGYQLRTSQYRWSPRVIAPIVDEATSLVVVRTRSLLLSRLAMRLLPAKAVFSWARDVVAPKVKLVAVPPPVAAMARDLAALDRGAVNQIGRGRPASRGCRSSRRLGRIAGGRLQHLVGDRLGGIDQALQRGEAGVGGLQHLHAVTDAVEQVVDVAGAVVEALRGEVVGRVVERRVDLVAGGEVILGGRKQRSRRLQGEKILTNG